MKKFFILITLLSMRVHFKSRIPVYAEITHKTLTDIEIKIHDITNYRKYNDGKIRSLFSYYDDYLELIQKIINGVIKAKILVDGEVINIKNSSSPARTFLDILNISIYTKKQI